MPTIIDSLVVLLNLDPKKFTEGQKKALESLRNTKTQARSDAKDVESSSKMMTDSLGAVRNSALRLFAVFTAGVGIKNFAEATTAAVAAQGRLAYNIGATTKEVALWQNAIKLTGGNSQAAAASMQGLQQSIQEFALTGQSSIIPYLRAIGVSLTDNKGQVKSLTDFYLDLADALAKRSPQEANFIGRQIGLDQDTINLLERGRAATQAYLDLAEKAGVANDAQAAELQKLQTAWENFGNAAVTVGRDILTQAAPAIESGLKRITDAIQNNRDKIENIVKGGGAGAIIGGIIGGIIGIPGGPVGIVLGAGTGATIGGALGAGTVALAQHRGYDDDSYGLDPQTNQPVLIPRPEPRGDARRNSVPPATPARLSLFDLIQRLENSGPDAVSPRGARGRNQIRPETAADPRYGFDPTRLNDPAYNDMVAKAIQADLYRRYHGDTEAIAIAYNGGPRRADEFLASGRNSRVLPEETQRYLARERVLTGGATSSTIINGNIIVNTRATDAQGIARDVHRELASQANQGPQ